MRGFICLSRSRPSQTRRKPSRRKLYNDYLMANHAYAEAKSKADILKYLPRGLTWEQAKGDVKGWAADLREAEANLDRLAGSRIREVIEDVAVAAARQTFEHAKAALKPAILVERALSPEGDELRVSVSHALSVAGASLQEAFEKTRPPASKKRNSKIARIIVARRAQPTDLGESEQWLRWQFEKFEEYRDGEEIGGEEPAAESIRLLWPRALECPLRRLNIGCWRLRAKQSESNHI